ncbi:MAG TPA: alanine dehydrogenase [Polyangiaceae bacterium]|nr:alanine dehydrogenase [Polyangiaceae bacterium]
MTECRRWSQAEVKVIVGVPKETKQHEYRTALLPVGVEELKRAGHRVLVQRGAGLGSGVRDAEYEKLGAELIDGPEGVFAGADLIVKVKEPQPAEIPMLRAGQLVFTYFHFAASESLTRGVLASGATAVAYETLQDSRGSLCLLTPMSEVAGRMSIQQGAKYLERPQEGRGILLGGVPGVEPAHITVIGGGVVGTNAAKIAAGFGAAVYVLDTNLDRLRYLDDIMPPNVTTLFSDRHTLLDQLTKADLVIGAVLSRGARTPRLVRREDLAQMKQGAVVVDVSVDQGGCFETTRPTSHADPTYVVDGVVHYAVTNMPGAVGRTSTYALCNATLPYVLKLARLGLEEAVREDPGFESAVNIHRGEVTHPAVAETFGLPYRALFT